ncbi:quinone-dependent dihydroorotate dehydrogenase [Halanaeroarchaeum sulfurireducens]|uniref:Dihydroorotate dehydrogenase (quinone) n=1 Tax=Halanaeroarchaeum sulfurireducens TaxID=1604004 RepID=A0A0F7PCR5_9EURY|nr:quinone-dependent dihydroorotate dehydrogenase [Halanaeroarchaeum sulfurireducens]AKH98487.1 dihydroorotate dehydrogenase 2 [Halanaeroarchaeum sulfurireducens]ALG82929.1 dihydroorotate dehydrogenase 2 [Halanaeroarchaeum sulfurireducens]
MYGAVKPLLFRLPPETAHDLIVRVLQASQHDVVLDVLRRQFVVNDDRLATRAFGVRFPNPVGVAAGFDKNARVPRALGALGFGHVEVGGVTAEAQPGNPRPRLFRLPEDRALINRMGFNNEGADAVGRRLANAETPEIPLGVNVGKSKSTPLEEAAEDYRYTYERVGDHADFVVVNVSSPNTPGLRDLQDREPLETILGTLVDAGASPLLVKVSPDLHREAIADVVELAEDLHLDGIVATNTTISRDEDLRNSNRVEEGGLSGKPLEARSTELVRFVASRTDLPVVGVGGIFTAEDAYEKIRAGASLVQLYTGLIYEGPTIARDINRGLLDRLERDGFDSITDAVGTDL